MSAQRRACIIGAGAVGCVAARRPADAGCTVEVYEARGSVGGNCYDEIDDHGILCHRYGPHYFRTDDEELLNWLSQFTEWTPGRYYVRCRVGDRLVPLPISLATMAELKGRVFTEEAFREYLAEQEEDIAEPANAEEQCLATVGRELYECIFAGYTQKQWGVPARELDPSITARIPLRFNWDERYPRERFQVMPRDGYTAMFERMVDHAGIALKPGRACDAQSVREMAEEHDVTIFTGPIDQLFGYRHGPLEYRSLRFEWEHHAEAYAQPCVQINYPDLDREYTRTVEIKHVTGQTASGTTVCTEYPAAEGEPFYPLLTATNRDRYAQYAALAEEEAKRERPLRLAGRLAEFRYYNMDQAFLRAMEVVDSQLKRWQ